MCGDRNWIEYPVRGIVCLALVLATLGAVAGCGGEGGTGSDGSRTVTMRFDLACVESIDYMKANDLSNYLQTYREGQPVDPAMQQVISSTTFGNRVSLLTGAGRARASFSFEPRATGSSNSGSITTYEFDKDSLGTKAGVPYVSVVAKVNPVATDLDSGDGTRIDEAQEARCLESTTFFPSTAPEVGSVAGKVTAGAGSTDAAITALWRWVREQIAYRGPRGTRYGTLKVLQQRYGRCWDKADVFVSLARASGIPTRQVAGWLSNQGAGHVWAQVYLDGKGWIGIDCTGEQVGTEVEYVPFFATYDGAMPILYVKYPTTG